MRIVPHRLSRWAFALTLAFSTISPAQAKDRDRAISRYALVVTNNRSLHLGRPDLHYADDDGIKYAQLFSELFGRVRVLLLTEPDAATTRLFPGFSASAQPPTLAQLYATVERLAKSIWADRKNGHEVHLHLVFAGHGDIDRGQGFIELADGRLRARDLDTKVIARLPADRIHLVLDSCNSYFMLNPRGPGSERWTLKPRPEQGLLDKYAHVGALISTSAEAETYEWSELQSGIFSYELRSAMRGAADVDGKPGVSYRETAAFIEVANRSVRNELYRPKIFVRGPGGDGEQTLIDHAHGQGPRLGLSRGQNRRITVRDSDGVRLLDVHKAADTEMTLTLPTSDHELQISEIRQGAERPIEIVRDLSPGSGLSKLAQLSPRHAPIRARGESPVFGALFALPYGKASFKNYRTQVKQPARVLTFGVSRADVQRLDDHLGLAASMEHRRRRRESLGLAIPATVLGVIGAVFLVGQPEEEVRWAGGAIVSSAALFAVGATLKLSLRTPLERVARNFEQRPKTTSAERAEALRWTEARWHSKSQAAKRLRHAESIIALTFGGLVTALGVTLAAEAAASRDPLTGDDNARLGWLSAGLMGAGLLTVGGGVWHLRAESPIEAGWRMYRARKLAGQRMRAQIKVRGLGVQGRF